MKDLTPAQIVRAITRREQDEVRIDAYDFALSELADAIEQIERARDATDRDMHRRDELIATTPKAGPDPVEVVTLAIHRAIHGDDEPKPEQLDRLRTYARAVVVDLAAAGYLKPGGGDDA